MGNLKCGTSRKWLIVERNGRKFGTRGTIVLIRRILLMPDSLSLAWGHSALCQISDCTIFEMLLLQQFSSDFINFIQSFIIRA